MSRRMITRLFAMISIGNVGRGKIFFGKQKHNIETKPKRVWTESSIPWPRVRTILAHEKFDFSFHFVVIDFMRSTVEQRWRCAAKRMKTRDTTFHSKDDHVFERVSHIVPRDEQSWRLLHCSRHYNEFRVESSASIGRRMNQIALPVQGSISQIHFTISNPNGSS